MGKRLKDYQIDLSEDKPIKTKKKIHKFKDPDKKKYEKHKI